MPLAVYIKSRLPLLAALAAFIICRLPALHYPFFWDESWSYAPGVRLMYLHGPSLMPNAIDLFYSRGHPLLFYASAAAWMRIFGASFISQHSFCLLLSLLTIVTAYEASLHLFGRRVATIVLLLVPLQVMFYVQSTMLLPEIMITLLALLSLYFYCVDKYLFTFLCCSALVLTKESGMVMGLVLGLHATAMLANKNISLEKRLKSFASIAGAGLVIGIFFLLQRALNGWYFFPEHTGLIKMDWSYFWPNFSSFQQIIFCEDNRVYLFRLLLLLCIIIAVQTRSVAYLLPLLPAYLIYVVLEGRFMWLSSKVFFPLILLSLLAAVFQLVRARGDSTGPQKKFMYLSFFFFAAYLSFSGINFFTARYLLCALLPVLILAACFIDHYISLLYTPIYQVALGLMLLVCFYGFKYNTGVGDCTLGAFPAMRVQQDVIDYVEKAQLYDMHITTASFQEREHLTKPYTGFLTGITVFKYADYGLTTNTQAIIFDNIEPDIRYDSIKNDTAGYYLAYKTVHGPAWAEIYRRKN